jgi:hypothetical protein
MGLSSISEFITKEDRHRSSDTKYASKKYGKVSSMVKKPLERRSVNRKMTTPMIKNKKAADLEHSNADEGKYRTIGSPQKNIKLKSAMKKTNNLAMKHTNKFDIKNVAAKLPSASEVME